MNYDNQHKQLTIKAILIYDPINDQINVFLLIQKIIQLIVLNNLQQLKFVYLKFKSIKFIDIKVNKTSQFEQVMFTIMFS